jgi:hypothetical protein
LLAEDDPRRVGEACPREGELSDEFRNARVLLPSPSTTPGRRPRAALPCISVARPFSPLGLSGKLHPWPCYGLGSPLFWTKTRTLCWSREQVRPSSRKAGRTSGTVSANARSALRRRFTRERPSIWRNVIHLGEPWSVRGARSAFASSRHNTARRFGRFVPIAAVSRSSITRPLRRRLRATKAARLMTSSNLVRSGYHVTSERKSQTG